MKLTSVLTVLASAFLTASAAEFQSAWPETVERVWIGPEYWANRLQDWRVANGRLECTTSGTNRNVGLLTRYLRDEPSAFEVSVRLGTLDKPGDGWAGFRIGAKGKLYEWADLRDHRDDVLRGKGLDCGITSTGQLFIGSPKARQASVMHRGIPRKGWKILHVDSTQGGGLGPKSALDGDPGTFWHSKYGAPPYPHEFQVDLGKAVEACGFVYVPRQDEPIGRIREYEFYVSADGKDWGKPVATGEFPNSTEAQEVAFEPSRGRYVRLHAKSDHAGRPAAVIAELFVLDKATAVKRTPAQAEAGESQESIAVDDVVLRLTGQCEDEQYVLELAAHKPGVEEPLATVQMRVPAGRATGAMALVCDAAVKGGARGSGTGGSCRFWFRDWTVSGNKATPDDGQAFGPIMWSQYTLTRGVLKLTAQMPPIGKGDTEVVRLEVQQGDAWREIARANIDPLACTARFRVPDWDSSNDVPYRLVYALAMPAGATQDHYWGGTIRRDPVNKQTIVVAAFTGNADFAFPNVEMVANVSKHNPDLLFFSGDQIYEVVGGYGTERSPLDRACLDYLRKWYCYGWAYREWLRDIPCVSIPDDHDVYQGNVWGGGGRKTDVDSKGGYTMPAEWVNMVQRTQTSHLPDAYDPTPAEQDITVYYTDLTYGRISFAVLEDRKFKSGPNGLVPPTGTRRPDHVADPKFDPKTADVPGAKLLGDRQLAFLRDWATDWRGADMKATLSQTVFAGAATHHGGGPQYLVADYDSNGWPQAGRNRALHEIRRAFAFMIGGDQHLATIIHHGIDDWNDAGWSFLVPSVANLYPRAWMPPREPHKRLPGLPDYTGEHVDGFGNKVTVWAATNPGPMNVEPGWLHNKKPGYGIVRFDKPTRKITMECWPRFADPADPKAQQYAGWPKTIDQTENYGRPAAAWLPVLKVTGLTNPVVQIVGEDGDVLYTLRIKGGEFRPKVFREGGYTIRVGEPDTDTWRTFTGVRSLPADETASLDVAF